MRETAPLPLRRGALPLDHVSSQGAWFTLFAIFAVGLARLAQLVNFGAVNVPFGDQWDFLAPLFRGEGPWSAFLQQHGPHRQGAGGLLQWFLYRGSAWDVRAEAWLGLILLCAAAVAAVGLMVRIRGRLVWWDSAMALIVLSPIHWETLLLAPNVAHSILPLFLTLALVHGWFMSHALARGLSVGFLGLLCTFTGFGFCATVAALLVTLASTSRSNADRHQAGVNLSLLGAGLVLFFIGYHWAPAVPGWHFPVAGAWNYGAFAAYMEATLMGLREKTPLALAVGGGVFLSVAGVFGCSLWRLWQRGATKSLLAAALLTGTCCVYVAFTAIGRLPAGIEAAFMWRYTTLTMTGLLGVVIFFQPWLESATTPLPRRAGQTALCILAVTIWINLGPEQSVAPLAVAKRRWVNAYLETRDLSRANDLSDFWVYPPQPNAPHIAERLHWLEERKLGFFAAPPP